MKRFKPLKFVKSIFALVAFLISTQSSGQIPVQEKVATTNPASKNLEIKKGFFFITPMYQLSYFDELKMVSHTNYYTVPDGEFSYEYNDEDIQEYNDNYGTEYHSSMIGIKLGYQVLNGLGVSVFAGVNHFYFQSWVSPDNTQTFNSDYPALSLGLAADYTKTLWEKWRVMALTSYTYTITGTGEVTNTTGLDVTSAGLTSMYWDVDLAVGYQVYKFLPFVGIGFTQQFVHPVTTEEIILQDENGANYTNKFKFDSHYQGSAIYGFAGLEFSINPKLAVYARSSFPNPFRVNTGIKIIL